MSSAQPSPNHHPTTTITTAKRTHTTLNRTCTGKQGKEEILHAQVFATRKTTFAMSHAKNKKREKKRNGMKNKWCTNLTVQSPKARINFSQNKKEFCLRGFVLKAKNPVNLCRLEADSCFYWPRWEGSMEGSDGRHRAKSYGEMSRKCSFCWPSLGGPTRGVSLTWDDRYGLQGSKNPEGSQR